MTARRLTLDEKELLLHYPPSGEYRLTHIDRSGRSKDESDLRRRLVRKGLLEAGPHRRQFRLTAAGKKQAQSYYAEITED